MKDSCLSSPASCLLSRGQGYTVAEAGLELVTFLNLQEY